MDNFNSIAYEAVDNYFTALLNLGYLNITKLNLLLLLLATNDLATEFSEFLTEEDEIVLNRIVGCLQSSSCLVPYSASVLSATESGIED